MAQYRELQRLLDEKQRECDLYVSLAADLTDRNHALSAMRPDHHAPASSMAHWAHDDLRLHRLLFDKLNLPSRAGLTSDGFLDAVGQQLDTLLDHRAELGRRDVRVAPMKAAAELAGAEVRTLRARLQAAHDEAARVAAEHRLLKEKYEELTKVSGASSSPSQPADDLFTTRR